MLKMTTWTLAMGLVMGLTGTAQARELPPIGEVPDIVLSGDVLPVPECDQVMERLQSLHERMVEHDGAVNGFLGQVSERLREWHRLLSPLEGSSGTIGLGMFDVLLDGAEKLEMILNMAWDNTSNLENELSTIMEGLSSCDLTKRGP